MMATDALRCEQRGVATRMAAAVLVTVTALSMALLVGDASPLSDRLRAMAAATVLAAAWLMAAIGNVARLRFFSASDIGGSAGMGVASSAVMRGNAVVQNTLEQLALAVPVYAALAIVVDRAVAVLLVTSLLFCIGRALFWAGYGRGARGRALGFTLTFYPTVGALLIVAARLIAHLE